MNRNYTYVTLLSTDNFLMGVLMLQWSLKYVHAQYPLFVLCSDSISDASKEVLNKYGIRYQILSSHISYNENMINTDEGYEHWNHTFDKLFVWSLTQFDKVVYLDSDMQVIRNIDYLFDCLHMSAVRADQWNEPGLDKLNSGLIVIEPNQVDFEGLCQIVQSGVVVLPNMGDQDIIRAYYSDWGTHSELTLHPGLNVFYSEIAHGIIHEMDVAPVSVIHYIGSRKPWMISPIAIWKRSRRNFLGKYLLRYAVAMYTIYPRLVLKKVDK